MNLFVRLQHEFLQRHIGPNDDETQQMLDTIKVSNIKELVNKTIPESIRLDRSLNLPSSMSEADYLAMVKEMSMGNKTGKTYIGQGYYDTHTPSVILRNVFENPGWYTSYTSYQAEISQGR